MKKQELRLRLPEIVQKIGTDGLREELAEYFETAGQSAAELDKLSDIELQELYAATFSDRDGEPKGWFEEWHRDYLGG